MPFIPFCKLSFVAVTFCPRGHPSPSNGLQDHFSYSPWYCAVCWCPFLWQDVLWIHRKAIHHIPLLLYCRYGGQTCNSDSHASLAYWYVLVSTTRHQYCTSLYYDMVYNYAHPAESSWPAVNPSGTSMLGEHLKCSGSFVCSLLFFLIPSEKLTRQRFLLISVLAACRFGLYVSLDYILEILWTWCLCPATTRNYPVSSVLKFTRSVLLQLYESSCVVFPKNGQGS